MTVIDEARNARARANGLGWPGEPTGIARRRWGRIFAGAAVMLGCGVIAGSAYVSAGSREEVLAVARPVSRFDVLEQDDLRVVRVAAEPGVATVPADRLDDLVGRPAATALVEGSLLSPEEVLDDDVVLGDGEASVGAVLAEEDSPANLSAGSEVAVVVRPPTGAPADTVTLRAWVLAVDNADRPGSEARRVTLVVPSGDVALVSAAAADDRVSVGVVGER